MMKSVAAAALFAGLVLMLPAQAETPAPTCETPLDLIRLANPLAHVAHKITVGEPITVVAIGSSSTSGAGASSPAANYPSRLAVELQRHFPRLSISVINRGVAGEEVADMLRRFDSAIVAVKPDLVLWQLGTNSVIRDHRLAGHDALIVAGLAKIRSIGADVVLIDPQFAPKVISKPQAEDMVTLISATAKKENIDLFRRFEMMRHWRDADHVGFETFVSPDGLHMNDWSYACMAKGLGDAIAEAAQRPILSATAASNIIP
ncbi:MAG TPA: GDSL-type esterase/lipase family protein [Pseudolabrys sp.]|nr:GDSL-type esterase/lipase family protein [Pseudolabrys sp.]